jgi:hypothetical protein
VARSPVSFHIGRRTSRPDLVVVVVPLAVTLVLIALVLKTDINRVIVLPQDPVYSVQDADHKAIVLGDVNRRNIIATAGLKSTFITITTMS